MHPYTAQRMAAERLADLHRAARRPEIVDATPSGRRPSLRRLIRLPARRYARASG
jgi:hypothetical protein